MNGWSKRMIGKNGWMVKQCMIDRSTLSITKTLIKMKEKLMNNDEKNCHLDEN